MLVHNEHIVEEQPACGETLCSVSDFRAKYQHIVDFDWDTECPMESGGAGKMSPLATLVMIVTSFITVTFFL